MVFGELCLPLLYQVSVYLILPCEHRRSLLPCFGVDACSCDWGKKTSTSPSSSVISSIGMTERKKLKIVTSLISRKNRREKAPFQRLAVERAMLALSMRNESQKRNGSLLHFM
ncbi:uncharacterized protein LOC129318877 [Prosopis cineraria]|uniref:uncharacterized protein LOC129318877 n=1 Tax=Prosopis cineraria TaxID=364024 RepID=UPI00240FA509|nr:uncharacterized protein LOC129318877 [Prosopis cineraria]